MCGLSDCAPLFFLPQRVHLNTLKTLTLWVGAKRTGKRKTPPSPFFESQRQPGLEGCQRLWPQRSPWVGCSSRRFCTGETRTWGSRFCGMGFGLVVNALGWGADRQTDTHTGSNLKWLPLTFHFKTVVCGRRRYGSRHTLVSPSESVLCLMSTAHARFLSGHNALSDGGVKDCLSCHSARE